MDFIETPIKQPVIRVGRDKKMSNKSTTQAEAPSKATKRYTKTRGEHVKDILIAVLIVGVVAFIGGVHYADSKNAQMQSAVKQAQVSAVDTTAKK